MAISFQHTFWDSISILLQACLLCLITLTDTNASMIAA